MGKKVLALGLDPDCLDPSQFSGFTASQVRAYIDAQLVTVANMGYEVESCLVDLGETAEAVVSRHLDLRSFDCVIIGAGLRAPESLLLFERLLNLVHARMPDASICFNTAPGDTAEAVRRWV